MAGKSGKLTNAALRERGPRMILTQGTHDNGQRLTVIFRQGQSCFKDGFGQGSFCTTDGKGEYIIFRTLAQSFTLSYLLNIGRANSKGLGRKPVPNSL
jgi:hypothetical protein